MCTEAVGPYVDCLLESIDVVSEYTDKSTYGFTFTLVCLKATDYNWCKIKK